MIPGLLVGFHVSKLLWSEPSKIVLKVDDSTIRVSNVGTDYKVVVQENSIDCWRVVDNGYKSVLSVVLGISFLPIIILIGVFKIKF